MLAASPLQPAPGPAVDELPAVPGAARDSETADALVGVDSAEAEIVVEGTLNSEHVDDHDWALDDVEEEDVVEDAVDAEEDQHLALDASSGVVVDDVAAAIAANALPSMSRGPRPGLLLGGWAPALEQPTLDNDALVAAEEELNFVEALQEQVDGATGQEEEESQQLSLPPLDGDGVLRTRHGEYFNPSLRRKIAPIAEQQPKEEAEGAAKEAGGGLLEQASHGLQVAARGLQQARPYIAARMIRYLPAADPINTSEGGMPVRQPRALTTAHGSYFDSKRRRQLLLQREATAREQQRAAAQAERAAAAAAVAAEEAAMQRREQEEDMGLDDEAALAEKEEVMEDSHAVAEEEDSPLPRTADGVRERLRRKLEQQEQTQQRGWGFW